MEKSYSASYAAAGVDITAGYRSVELMKQYVARTMTENCIGGLGGFGGLFELDCTGMEHPVLISGTDGVGTKLRVAQYMNKHDTIGIDCVAMCVNDVICAGAKEVHYRISAPPFAHPCYFGTDIPDQKLLIANGHTVEEINKIIGSDTLGYLSVEHVQQLAPASKFRYCTGCFTGQYPVAPPTETMESVYDRPLSQSNKNKKL